jgi:hypothetical protein
MVYPAPRRVAAPLTQLRLFQIAGDTNRTEEDGGKSGTEACLRSSAPAFGLRQLGGEANQVHLGPLASWSGRGFRAIYRSECRQHSEPGT